MAKNVDIPSKWLNILLGSVLVSALSNIYGNTLWRLIISDTSPLSTVGWLVVGALIGGASVLALPPIEIRLPSSRSEPEHLRGIADRVKSAFVFLSVTAGTYVVVLGSILSISRLIPVVDPNLGIVGVIVLVVGLVLGIGLVTTFPSLRLGCYFTGVVTVVALSYNVLQSTLGGGYIGGFEPNVFFLVSFVPFAVGVLVHRTYGYSLWEMEDSSTS